MAPGPRHCDRCFQTKLRPSSNPPIVATPRTPPQTKRESIYHVKSSEADFAQLDVGTRIADRDRYRFMLRHPEPPNHCAFSQTQSHPTAQNNVSWNVLYVLRMKQKLSLPVSNPLVGRQRCNLLSESTVLESARPATRLPLDYALRESHFAGRE